MILSFEFLHLVQFIEELSHSEHPFYFATHFGTQESPLTT